MTRIVPHQDTFENARKLEITQNIVLILLSIATIGSIILNSIKNTQDFNDREGLINTANTCSTLFSVAFIVLDMLINDRFYSAGLLKRVDLVDHAFATNFSGEKSTGYFNPGGVNPGIYKLAVLGFENSLFTCTVARKMTFPKWIAAAVILILFIISASVGEKNLFNNMIQLAATAVLIQQAFRLQTFANRMNRIHTDFKGLFNRLKDVQDKTSAQGEIVKNVLNYEATHSWGSILLDTKIFNSINPTLSTKWEKMKQDYNV